MTPALAMGDILKRVARRYPNREALIDGEVRLTYREFNSRVNRFSRALQRMGMRSGDVVAILSFNRHEYLEAYFACAKLSCILNILNWRLTNDEIDLQCRLSKSRVLLVDHGLETQFSEVVTRARDRHAHVVIIGGSPDTGDNMDFDALLQCESSDEPDTMLPQTSDPVLLLYTSGTTGSPKGALLTQENFLWNGITFLYHAELTRRDKLLQPMPLCHVGGIHMLTAAFILKGLPIVLERTFSVEETLLLIQRERPTVLNILMAPLQLLLTSPELPQGDASSLRLVLTAAAKYTREFCLEVIYKLGLDQLIFGYGLTEASPTVTLTESTAETIWKENSIGWPVWINEVRVVDAASEQEVSAGSVGELLVRGPNVFSGYFGQPEQTAQALRDGWLWTGDYVREDEEGCLFFVDRRTDMVKTGGENVSATEVEVAILHCNGTLADAVVVGMPDPVWGEAIAAFCVVKPGQNTSEDEIRANLRGYLASYKIPKAVFFVQDLPRSISGKVQKHILRQQLSDGTVSTPSRTDDNPTLS